MLQQKLSCLHTHCSTVASLQPGVCASVQQSLAPPPPVPVVAAEVLDAVELALEPPQAPQPYESTSPTHSESQALMQQ